MMIDQPKFISGYFPIMDSHDSAKKHQSFQENMIRLYGEIERYFYAAEIACVDRLHCNRCPFKRKYPDPKGKGVCIIPELRELIGEHKP